MGTPLGEYPLSLIILSVALLVLGPIFMLHEKSKGRGFSLALLGSFGLMFASFAHGYRILALEKIEAGESYFRFVNPLREYTLPIVLVSAAFLILGYALMLSKSRVSSDNVSSRVRD
jgi:dipeptide/tripeptide permease